MKINIDMKQIHLSAILLIPHFLPLVAMAQTYSTLIEADDLFNQGSGLVGLLNGIYLVVVGLAAILAVLKIIIAGVKYMLSEVVTDKGSAKKDIQNALLGLLILLSTYLILDFINPNLVGLNFIDNLRQLETQSPPAPNSTSLSSQNQAANEAAASAAANAADEVSGGCNERSENTSNPDNIVIVIDYSGCTTPPGVNQVGATSSFFQECADRGGRYDYDQNAFKVTCTIATNPAAIVGNTITSVTQRAGTKQYPLPDDGSVCRESNTYAGFNPDTEQCYWPTTLEYDENVDEDVARQDCFSRTDGYFMTGWGFSSWQNYKCVICPGTFVNVSGPLRGYECTI